MSELLRIHDLNLTIRNEVILNDVHFYVNAGERVSIVGESGSGKTLTALSVIGLNPGKVNKGKVFFESRELSKAIHGLRGKEIGYVFQEPSLCLNPAIRCGEQVSEVIRTHLKLAKKEADLQTLGWFSKVGFDDCERIFNSYPHQLSGGQKQRVMLCIAMAPKPKLLIADEPTTALDVAIQQQIVQLLLSLCKENHTALLFITHDLDLAAHMSERCIVMKNGKIVEEGISSQILQNPKNAYTQKLIETRITLKTNAPEKIKPSEEIVVSAKNITAKYSTDGFFSDTINITALDNISLEIKRGETLGLVGESGSGKSTMANVLMGLKKPEKGTVELFRKNMYEMDGKELQQFRKKFRVIFQDPYSSFNPKLTIGSQIQETMSVYDMHGTKKNREEKTRGWLVKVGLKDDDYKRFPHMFSGGQRQRIAIARALACEPEFLVCDECISSLDVSLQRDILELLLSLQNQYNMSMLFISHDPGAVKFMCDNVLVLKGGKTMEYGKTMNVWNNPQAEYTRRLLEAVNQN